MNLIWLSCPCRQFFMVITLLHIWVGQGLAAAPEMLATAPAKLYSDAKVSEKKFRFNKFYDLWSASKFDECREFFADDTPVVQTPKIFAEAVLKADMRKQFKFHRKYLLRFENIDGGSQIEIQSYWLAEDPAKVENPSLLILSESFTEKVIGGVSYIGKYDSENVTDQEIKRVENLINEWREVFEDSKEPNQKRLFYGVKVYLALEELARHDQMWPLLVKLVDLNLMDAKEHSLVRASTLAASRASTVPEKYSEVVSRVCEGVQSK